VVERFFVWTLRFRRLARDYERLTQTLEGYRWLAFSILMLAKVTPLIMYDYLTGSKVHNTL